jgi:hypothetical protein
MQYLSPMFHPTRTITPLTVHIDLAKSTAECMFYHMIILCSPHTKDMKYRCPVVIGEGDRQCGMVFRSIKKQDKASAGNCPDFWRHLRNEHPGASMIFIRIAYWVHMLINNSSNARSCKNSWPWTGQRQSIRVLWYQYGLHMINRWLDPLKSTSWPATGELLGFSTNRIYLTTRSLIILPTPVSV